MFTLKLKEMLEEIEVYIYEELHKSYTSTSALVADISILVASAITRIEKDSHVEI